MRDRLERGTEYYAGPNCKVEPDPADAQGWQRSKCDMEDNIPFEITEEMKGQVLTAEETIVEDPLRVSMPVLREGVTR